MSSSNQPFFRKSRNAWYLQVGKKQIKLAENKAEAWVKWHAIMSTQTQPGQPKAAMPLKDLCQKFLDYLSQSASPRTCEWYAMYVELLAKHFKGADAESVRACDIESFIAGRKTWGANSRHNFARAVKRIYSWAEVNELITKNPLKHLKKPSPQSRTDFITAEQMEQIEKVLPENALKDLLIVAWDTGIRPQEIILVESRHCHLDHSVICFAAEESKGKKRPRAIYLPTSRSVDIIKRLITERPYGPIFRNFVGEPWNRNSIGQALRRYEPVFGFKTHLGAFRKGYCTAALQNGVDPVTLSKLMGHADTTMISRVYAQVHQDIEFMLSSAKKAKGMAT